MKNTTFIARLSINQQTYILECLKAYGETEGIEININEVMADRLWIVEDIIDMGILASLR